MKGIVKFMMKNENRSDQIQISGAMISVRDIRDEIK